MTALPKPGFRPANPHFSSGPCAKRPGWSVEALKDAALGRSHRAKEGKARLKIPAGTQNGKVFRMKGKGVASLDGRGRGDQMVTIFVETPSHLNARQKELLEEFAKLAGEDSTPHRKSFLDKAKAFFT